MNAAVESHEAAVRYCVDGVELEAHVGRPGRIGITVRAGVSIGPIVRFHATGIRGWVLSMRRVIGRDFSPEGLTAFLRDEALRCRRRGAAGCMLEAGATWVVAAALDEAQMDEECRGLQ